MVRAKADERRFAGNYEIYKKYYVDATNDIILIFDSEDDFHDHLIDIGIIQPK